MSARQRVLRVVTTVAAMAAIATSIPLLDASAAAGDCQTSASAWQSAPFAAQPNIFSFEFDATPASSNVNGLTVLSSGAPDAFTDGAAIVRFTTGGTIDARNGSLYASETEIEYEADVTYHVRLEVNVPAHTYSVYVRPDGGMEQAIAFDYAFRTEQAAVGSLDHWGTWADPGTHDVCAAVVSPCSIDQAHAAPLHVRRVAHDLSRPVGLTSTPADPGHVYVIEHWSGRIFRIDPETEAMELFHTVPGLAIGYSIGLVGMAFHPDYAENGRFYVSFMRASPTEYMTSVIGEYTVDALGNVGSYRDIFTYEQPDGQHNNGWIDFGPDGMLYIASGDGGDQFGGTHPPLNRSQRLDSVFGKIFRIDVDGQDPGLAYRIPDNDPPTGETPNPYVGKGGAPHIDSFGGVARAEIWALGFRSPWRPSFDRLTGDLYIADVGDSDWEWIDFIPAGSGGGQNFGWCVVAGSHSVFGVSPTQDALMAHCVEETTSGPFAPPIYEYPHAPFGGSKCVIGGYAYRGSAIPWLAGTFFFGDNTDDTVRSFRYTQASGLREFIDRTEELEPDQSDVPPQECIFGPSSFGEDVEGELYIVAHTIGTVYRIESEEAPADCDSNGLADACEISLGLAGDSDRDGVLDSCEPQCPGDVNDDGLVGFGDLVSLLLAWGPCAVCPEDIDADGEVDFSDLQTLLIGWGLCARGQGGR